MSQLRRTAFKFYWPYKTKLAAPLTSSIDVGESSRQTSKSVVAIFHNNQHSYRPRNVLLIFSVCSSKFNKHVV